MTQDGKIILRGREGDKGIRSRVQINSGYWTTKCRGKPALSRTFTRTYMKDTVSTMS